MLGWIAGAVGKAVEGIFGVIDEAVSDQDLAARLKARIQTRMLGLQEALVQERAAVIQAEASGESWLQRSWRPLVMLFFTGLVGAHWMGWTAPNISDAIVSDLLAIVKLGLGGYVIGRSAEKTVKLAAPAVRDGLAKRKE